MIISSREVCAELVARGILETDMEMWLHETKHNDLVRCMDCVSFRLDKNSSTGNKGYCVDMDSGRTDVYKYSYKICKVYERRDE